MKRFALPICMMMLALTGCEDNAAPVRTSDAGPVVRQVLDAVAAGNAEAVYKTHFTEEHRSRVSLADWTEVADAARKRLGKVQTMARETTFATHRYDDGAASATLLYRVVWENGSGTVYASLLRNGDWKVNSIEYRLPPADADAPTRTTPTDAGTPSAL
ncbi:MAG: hypothetical protein GVY16_09160 [Planctomycetes bacterium]|jgi:hypothetical protein|nr:hypothetical protein [Planctomycetota bacterium]